MLKIIYTEIMVFLFSDCLVSKHSAAHIGEVKKVNYKEGHEGKNSGSQLPSLFNASSYILGDSSSVAI